MLQSNGYAYSTPTSRQMLNPSMAERLRGGWGVPAETVDGTDAIASYTAIRAAVERARGGEGPQAVECISMRIDGHAAHDDGKYMDQERRREYVERRDPIERLLARLRLDGADDDDLAAAQASALDEVNAGLAEAESRPAPDFATLADGVYASPLP